MTPEQKQRIEQIELARKSGVLPWSHLSSPTRINNCAASTVDFLLSLVKSQEADAGSIDGELNDLHKEYGLSGLGDRPHSISAAKLKRLIELESGEKARRDMAVDPIWPLARQVAGELDRQALFYASRGDRPLTDDELAPAIVVIVGVLSTEQSDAATSMRSACVEKVEAARRKHEQVSSESEDYEYHQAAVFALACLQDELEKLIIENTN